MPVTAKPLILAKYAADTLTNEYTVPAGTRTIIDKFTATNISGGAVTLNVHIVPPGGSADNSNKILSSVSIASNATLDSAAMQNQIMSATGFISVSASAASSIVIRASGREVT